MNKRLLLWSFCSMLVVHGYAQPTIDWQQTYGGTSGEGGRDIAPTADGGYIVLGRTISNDEQVSGNNGFFDIWVIKINGEGALEWQRCLGGSAEEDASDIDQTADGGYMLIGTTFSNDGDVSALNGSRDMWVVKLSATGALEWERTYGGSGADEGRWIHALDNGDVLLFGWAKSPELEGFHGSDYMWCIRINATGEQLEQRCYGGSGTEAPGDAAELSNGQLLLCGATRSTDGDVTGNQGQSDAWVISLNPDLSIAWQRCLGGTANDDARAICSGSSGEVYVAVTTQSLDGDISDPHGGPSDFWIVRLSAQGAILAERSFGGTALDSPRSIVYSAELGLFVCGLSLSTDGDVSDPQGNNDGWLVALEDDLTLKWERSLGGSNADVLEGMCWAPDGGLVVIGQSLSTDGDLTDNFGSSDLWVVKFNPETVGITEASSSAGLTLYPNPSSDQVRIQWSDPAAQQLEVADALGRVVYQEQLRQKGNNERVLAVGDWANGLYTVRVLGQKAQQVSRFIKKN